MTQVPTEDAGEQGPADNIDKGNHEGSEPKNQITLITAASLFNITGTVDEKRIKEIDEAIAERYMAPGKMQGREVGYVLGENAMENVDWDQQIRRACIVIQLCKKMSKG